MDFLNKILKRNKIIHNNEFSSLPNNIINKFNKTRPIKARKYFCNAPFRNMYFSPEGNVYACCFNQKQNFGNIQKKSLKEIWKSENSEKLRSHIKNFELISGCDECKYALLKEQYQSAQISCYDKYSGHPEYPTYMEFQISKECNLECTMCTGDFSSSIASKREKRKPWESPFRDEYLSQLEEFIPYLKYTLFSGGEPFISPVYYNIWEMIHSINPECVIMVQTNGTILNDKVKKVIEGGVFNIGISLDSLNEDTYKSIRVNASLSETLKNISFFKDYCNKNNYPISITFCPMQQNWKEIPDIIKYCNKNDMGIFFSTVWFPGKNALWVLDSQKIKEIVSTLTNQKFKVEKHLHEVNVKTYHNLIKTLDNWYKVACRWESYQPKEIDSIEIEKMEFEIIQKIRNYYADKSSETQEVNSKANDIIAQLQKIFDLVPNNDLKYKGLQFIAGLNDEKIIANIFRENDEGLYLLLKNLHRFRDL